MMEPLTDKEKKDERLIDISSNLVFKVIRRIVDNDTTESTLDVAAFQSSI